MGIQKITEVLMILGVSTQMNQKQKDVTTSLMIQGFVEAATQARVKVGGGQSVYNMWPMLGGCAVAAIQQGEFRWPYNARIGDVLVLTKGIGTRLAINSMQWLKSDKQKKAKILPILPESKIQQIFYKAQEQMATLNIVGARLMKKYNSHACTDVTGFGILGHANYLAQAQKQSVNFRIDKLPIIRDIHKIQKVVQDFKLFQGYAAETSGGLLIAFDKQNAKQFIQEMKLQGLEAWEIGNVQSGQRKAYLNPKLEIIQV